jgi:YHS domain-containing protein
VDGIFSAAGLIPEHRPSIDSITSRGITWNYTTFLNIVFTLVAAGLVWLTLRRGARDPVCGMTVDRGTTLTSEFHGKAYYFCSPGCRERFEEDPERYVFPAGRDAAPLEHAGHRH